MVREARAPLYPSLSAGSEYAQFPGYSVTITNGGLSDGLLTLNYTAFDFGRRLAAARRRSIKARPTAMACAPHEPR